MGERLPSLSTRQVVRAFERAGYSVVPSRGKGSHVAMATDEGPILIIPSHGDVPRGTLRALIRQSGLTVEQFLNNL